MLLKSWKRLLRVPWTSRRSNLSILKEINPEYSLEGLMLKLKLQYFATWCEKLTHWKRSSCWERLKLGGEGDKRGSDIRMASLTRWTWVWASSKSWWWTGKPGMVQSMGLQRVGHKWATELNWLNRLGFWLKNSKYVLQHAHGRMLRQRHSQPTLSIIFGISFKRFLFYT